MTHAMLHDPTMLAAMVAPKQLTLGSALAPCTRLCMDPVSGGQCCKRSRGWGHSNEVTPLHWYTTDHSGEVHCAPPCSITRVMRHTKPWASDHSARKD